MGMGRRFRRGRKGGRGCVPPRPAVSTRHLGQLEEHVTRHLGPIAFVSHETDSELVHLDVLAVAPTAGRDHWTLVTSGMSDAPMQDHSCREHGPVFTYAELVMGLPADWRFDALEDERWSWPLSLLRGMARHPHERDTWLHYRHLFTAGRGSRPEAFAPGLPFRAAFLLPPIRCPEGFWTLRVGGREIDMLGVCLLLPEEEAALRRVGHRRFVEGLDLDRFSEVLDPARRRSAWVA